MRRRLGFPPKWGNCFARKIQLKNSENFAQEKLRKLLIFAHLLHISFFLKKFRIVFAIFRKIHFRKKSKIRKISHFFSKVFAHWKH